jgi:hypothetical protein
VRPLSLPIALVLTSPASAAGPTCALLDPEKTPRAALLEAKLLAEPGATWVERAGIDKVLKEQKLQAAFSPQGVGERVKLGRLLKADVLVLIRPVKDAPAETLEVVVSETAGGLRLLHRAVPVTKNAADDAAALLAAAKDGIARHGEAVREIVAVPAFASNDLEFTRDHLRGAFAKLAEAEALGRKGVLVVELEEAEAVAKEIALAAPGTALARPLPVYLLGEYRHDGKGKDVSVAIKLRGERGGKPVGKPEALALKPDESPAAVRKWSAALLDSLAQDSAPRPPADPKLEAKQLADRALALRQLGNWAECLTLLEASLLLDPAQTDLHAEAVKSLTPLVGFLRHRACYPEQFGKVGKADKNPYTDRFALLYRRGMAHLGAFADKGGNFFKYSDAAGGSMLNSFRGSAGWLIHPGTGVHPDMERVLRELKPEDDALMARLNPLLSRQYYEWTNRPRPATTPAVAVRLAPRETFTKPDGYDPDAPPDPAAHRLKLTPVALSIPPPKPPDGPVKRLNGLVAAGPGIDVVWGHHAVYRMTEKGKLRLAWEAAERNTLIRSVEFDGKFVWCVASRHRGGPILFVLDPATGKVHDLTAADSLPALTAEQKSDPLASHRITLAPLGPGRACVAGGAPRVWVAVATCDPNEGKAAVRVIRDTPNLWLSTTVAFRPSFMLTLRGAPDADGKTPTRVLLGRGNTSNLDVNTVPLVIDPDAPSVTVAPFPLSSGNYANEEVGLGKLYATSGGAAYRADRIIYPRLLRVPFPGTAREVVAEALPQSVSFLAFEGGRAHVVQTRHGKYDPSPKDPLRGPPAAVHWYVVEPGEKRPKLVGVNLPRVDYVAVSSHYGLVAIVSPDKQGEAWTLQTVEFVDPKK